MDVEAAVEETMAAFESSLPPGVKWRIDSNNAEEFRRRLTLVGKNALMAVGIVLLILALFLEIRLAFWVMMGMVISFIGGVLLLPPVWRQHQHDFVIRIPGGAGNRGRRCGCGW